MLRLAMLLVAFALAAPRLLTAQSPEQRAEIEAFRDSVISVSDSGGLLAFERALIARASHDQRDSAMIHLRLGFVALRLGDAAGRKHYQDAASEFQWVVDLQPKWPYGWFGLGLAELGIGDAEFSFLRGLQTALGKDALTRSANNFARSAQVDPSFVRGLVELSNTALSQRINLRMDVALVALRNAAHTPAGRHPEVLLARARVEREVGDGDSALAAADSLLSHSPTSAIALHEVARARFHVARIDGGEPWYRGLANADSKTLQLYRDELLFILPDSTMRAFDAATPMVRARLIRGFWDMRDRDALQPSGARLREHYRRLDLARREYRLATIHRHYDIVERYRPGALDFDDRGVIYIRHGEPDKRARVALPGLPSNESWVYHQPEAEDLLFHFVARESVTDFRLVASALDVLDYARTLQLQGSGDLHGNTLPLLTPGPVSRDSAARLRQHFYALATSRVAETVLRSRLELNPIYSRLLGAGPGTATGLEGDERALGLRSIRIGTVTDSWLPHFTHDLPAVIQLLAMGGDSTQPMMQVAWSVPASAVTGEIEPGTGQFLPRVQLSVFDSSGRPRAVVDTTVVSVATTGATHRFGGLIPVAVPPGRMTVRLAISAGSLGLVTGRDSLESARRNGPVLLSDLAIGRGDLLPPAVSLAGDTIWVSPAAEFRPATPMQLYFEVSNQPADSAYRIEIALLQPEHHSVVSWVAGVFGKSNTALRVRLTRHASGTLERIHQVLGLEKLRPGKYVLEVTVSAPAGVKRVRRQDFTIIP